MLQTIKDCGCAIRIKTNYGKTYYVSQESNNSVTQDLQKACMFRSWPFCAVLEEVKKNISKGKYWQDADDSSNKGRIMLFKKNCKVDAPNVERVTTVEKRLK